MSTDATSIRRVYTYTFHERAAHFCLNLVEKFVLVVAMLVLEVDNDVHLYQHLRREHVVGASRAFLQPHLERFQSPASHTLLLLFV